MKARNDCVDVADRHNESVDPRRDDIVGERVLCDDCWDSTCHRLKRSEREPFNERGKYEHVCGPIDGRELGSTNVWHMANLRIAAHDVDRVSCRSPSEDQLGMRDRCSTKCFEQVGEPLTLRNL